MENVIGKTAHPQAATVPASGKAMRRTGIVLSALPTLFLLLDGAMKLVKPAEVVNGTVELGYRENVIVPIGIVLIVITLLYAIPRTAFVGAILLTGYLGGAVATHVRVGAGAFNILFPVIFGIFIWGGLYLRDARLRNLLAGRS
ncbi:MAG: DoxX family protein [Acidobacteriota bacterium]